MFTGDLPELMYKTSFHLNFFWVDDYYITGILATGVNATYKSFNSLYIVNNNLVETRFLGKQSEHTVFGHIPGHINKMYKLWNFVLENQLNRFPSLNRMNPKFLTDNDFIKLNDFYWSKDFWLPFIKSEAKIDNNINSFNLDTF